MGNFALVKNSIVENIIVADKNFATAISAQYDYVLDTSHYNPTPHIGDSYDSIYDIFFGNSQQIIGQPKFIPVTPSLLNGSQPTLSPFSVKDNNTGVTFAVKVNGKNVNVGCLTFYAPWLTQVLFNIVNGVDNGQGGVTKTANGAQCDGFEVSTSNLNLMISQLQTLNFTNMILGITAVVGVSLPVGNSGVVGPSLGIGGSLHP